MSLRLIPRVAEVSRVFVRMSSTNIRDAGGVFGKMEQAREEEYFYKLQKAQLKSMKEQISREIEHHEKQAKNHQDVIERHKKRIAELEAENQSLEKN
uniref:ATPase inhibitor, mitochondrial n=1 Tax=Steinernema glaseri TaxID=37863 RepID=A0A1I7ZE33_9BILA